MKRKRDLIERRREFNELSDAEKIEWRLSWLEQKTVEVAWGIVSVFSMAFGAFGAWIASETIGSGSIWLLAPIFVFSGLMAGWWAHRRTFRGAPPHIDFIDP